MQTTLNNKLNTMLTQDASAKATQMSDFLGGLETMGKAEEEANLKRLKGLKVVADAEKATAEAVKSARLGIVSAGFDALKSMAATEKQQKKLAIAQILVNQGIALSNAIAGAQAAAAATGPAAPISSPILTATMIGIVLTSFAQIKGVMNQAGAATAGLDTTTPSLGGGGNNSPLALTPDFASSFGSGPSAIPPVQAYVLQTNIADASALQQELVDQSSL
tara:strand:- start:43 stop:702 length:660 start_codon:yes stop_codon:yes gene_type:complete